MLSLPSAADGSFVGLSDQVGYLLLLLAADGLNYGIT